jgi:hypothetical protein
VRWHVTTSARCRHRTFGHELARQARGVARLRDVVAWFQVARTQGRDQCALHHYIGVLGNHILPELGDYRGGTSGAIASWRLRRALEPLGYELSQQSVARAASLLRFCIELLPECSGKSDRARRSRLCLGARLWPTALRGNTRLSVRTLVVATSGFGSLAKGAPLSSLGRCHEFWHRAQRFCGGYSLDRFLPRSRMASRASSELTPCLFTCLRLCDGPTQNEQLGVVHFRG